MIMDGRADKHLIRQLNQLERAELDESDRELIRNLKAEILQNKIRFDNPRVRKRTLIWNIDNLQDTDTETLNLDRKWTGVSDLKENDIVYSYYEDDEGEVGPRYFKAVPIEGLIADRNIHLVFRAIQTLERSDIPFEDHLHEKIKVTVMERISRDADKKKTWANRRPFFKRIDDRIVEKLQKIRNA